MKANGDVVLSSILVVCALLTTGTVLYRNFVARPAISAEPLARRPVYVQNWRSQLSRGAELGPASAPVQLIEFADFECPFCAVFHDSVKKLQLRYRAQVSLTYIYFPLPMHRFAIPAAHAAECARNQGRFEEMYDRLFGAQESFGAKSWSTLAIEAGVPDIDLFDACVKSTEPVPRIDDGLKLGSELGVKGTPTVIVNGWRLGEPPSEEQLESMVKDILAGRNPVAGGRTS
jgi:protein-disulfide isomerase